MQSALARHYDRAIVNAAAGADSKPGPDPETTRPTDGGTGSFAMPTYIMLTRIAPGSVASPADLEKLERELMGHIRKACPEVEWLQNFAVMGPWDYVDVFEAPDMESATRVSALVRTHGKAYTETWPATGWGRFKELVHGLA